jgi:hypothetical protein
MAKAYLVSANWDPAAGVWVAISDDIPGLKATADSLNLLLEKVRAQVPKLLRRNGGLEPGQKSAKVVLRAHSKQQATVVWLE